MTLLEKPAAVDAHATHRYAPDETRRLAVAVIACDAAPGEMSVGYEIAEKAESLRKGGLTPRHASRALHGRKHRAVISEKETRRFARAFLACSTPEEIRTSSLVLRGTPAARRRWAAIADQMDNLIAEGTQPEETR